MTAKLLLPYDAPREEWLAARRGGIGASEIAAVMGISPWDSPFSIWWRKHMGWDLERTAEMDAGIRLEPVVADWFADGHPGLYVTRSGLWCNTDREWQLATPDRDLHLHELGVSEHPMALLECKAAYSWDGWGDDDTGEIPVHYRTQCLWQIDTVEVGMVWVAAFAGLTFRQFRVMRDEKDLRAMREAGRRFMDSLAEGEPPDVDDHAATLPTIRRLNEAIEDREQEIPQSLATGWLRSKRFKDLADRVERRYSARMRAHMGTARTAVCNGTVIAARTAADQLRRKA